MWKNLFYFSHAQRVGILVLVALILLVLILKWSIPILIPIKNSPVDSVFLAEAQKFRNQVMYLDSVDSVKYRSFKKFSKLPGYNHYYSKSPISSVVLELKSFDPNSADSLTLLKLGLKKYIVSNILKYRKSGGKYKTVQDFSRIYGLDSLKLKELKPYIDIQSTIKVGSKDEKIYIQPVKTIPQAGSVDLNKVDTTELLHMKGIGKYMAKAIVGYRKYLGGYYTVNQLKEIKGFREEFIKECFDYFSVNQKDIIKIRVNTASVEKFKNHPYLSFYQAKAIYELRRKKGRLKNIDEMGEIDLLSKEDLMKLSYYFDFQ